MTYRAPVRAAGLRAALRAVVRPEYRMIEAVADLSFALRPGEIVGFLGPNGAGKTTTMKMLAGVLHPTAGEARVLGFVPWRRRPAYLRQIALIRGTKSVGAPSELTVADALRYQQLLYEVPDIAFARNLDELSDLLGLGPLLGRQVRALSLGERTRAGLALALIYRPRVLFLDEPTLGLDVSVAAVLRRFIAGYAARTGATVLLTSHYMTDVEAMCRRVILVDRGRLRYDGPLTGLAERLFPDKLIRVAVADGVAIRWEEFGTVEQIEPGRVALRVPRVEVPALTGRLLAQVAVADLAVEDPPLDTVLDRFYRDAQS